jgi:hypothetical protein
MSALTGLAQMGLRRTAAMSPLSVAATSKTIAPAAAATNFVGARRWKGADAGDVIGIDLGTTNSCVAVMVRFSLVARCICDCFSCV